MPRLCDLSDKELFEGLKCNYDRVLEEIYKRYYSKLLVVALNRLDNQEEAEECVQDVFFNLYKQRETLVLQSDSLSYYLVRAVMNRAFRMMSQKHRQRMQQASYQPELITEISPERQFIARELQERIENAIDSLPPQCQLVFRMNKEQGLTAKEISQQLDISENTVNSHLKKAKNDIRKSLDITLPFILQLLLYFQQHIH